MTLCPHHTHDGLQARGGAMRTAGRPAYGRAWGGVRPSSSRIRGIQANGTGLGFGIDSKRDRAIDGFVRLSAKSGRYQENQRGRTGAGGALARP